MTTIFWFRQDLRISDNPALHYAASLKAPLVLVYIVDTNSYPWSMGAVSRWWLHESLLALSATLKEKYQSQLIFKKGDPLTVLQNLVSETKSNTVVWNRCYEPESIKRDLEIKASLKKKDIHVKSFNSALLKDPWEYQNSSKQPYSVFTPFWKSLQKEFIREVIPAPRQWIAFDPIESESLSDLDLLPDLSWYHSLAEAWHVGEKAAQQRLSQFLKMDIGQYKLMRNFPAGKHTSQLSPHLHFGEISPVQIWWSCQSLLDKQPNLTDNIQNFLSEIAWREFSYHLLYYHADLPDNPIKTQFKNFRWENNPAFVKCWQQGLTGYPIVDAGMRELWQTGWMHNRVRMIAASFLIKDLLQPWQIGEAWFWDTLVDADLANNAASWQWVAGCGADAAPYFRVFNPVLQGEKFDPEGTYVKKWIPELKNLPKPYIHQPFAASAEILQKAKVFLGKTYPLPIVEHGERRKIALEAYGLIKSKN